MWTCIQSSVAIYFGGSQRNKRILCWLVKLRQNDIFTFWGNLPVLWNRHWAIHWLTVVLIHNNSEPFYATPHQRKGEITAQASGIRDIEEMTTREHDACTCEIYHRCDASSPAAPAGQWSGISECDGVLHDGRCFKAFSELRCACACAGACVCVLAHVPAHVHSCFVCVPEVRSLSHPSHFPAQTIHFCYSVIIACFTIQVP